ncbi:MAG: hypothetical protein ACRDWY_18335 [Actinomycetes bacterium]
MIFRRLVLVMSLALAAAMALGSPATAADYPTESGDATVSATVISQGGTVTISGEGFAAGCDVRLFVTQGGEVSAPGQNLTADADGSVSTSVKLTERGSNVLTLEGCGQALTARVNVRAAAAGNAGLPGTGGDLTSLWAGMGLLLAGSLLVGVTRSRRKITV